MQFGFVAPAQATPDIVASYSEANQNGEHACDALHPSGADEPSAWGQSFNCTGGNYKITQIKFYLNKYGSPSGYSRAELYAHSGTFGSSSVPTGSALAQSNWIDVSTFSGSLSLVTFTFNSSQQYEMQENTVYCPVYINPTSGTIDGSNYVSGGKDSSSPTHDGNSFRYKSGGWSPTAIWDFAGFYVYGVETGVPPTWSNQRWNSTRAGNVSQLSVSLSCGDGLDYFWVESNNTGSMVNSSAYSLGSAISATALWNTTLASTGQWVKSCVHFNSTTGSANSTDWVWIQTTAVPAADLYIDGADIKRTGTGATVVLRGVNKHGFEDYPGGKWPDIGDNALSGNDNWNETSIKGHLRAMKVWGFNYIRVITSIEWWVTNQSNHIGKMKQLAEWCNDSGLYMMYTPWNVNHTNGNPNLPYPPYQIDADDEAVIGSKQAWIDYWVNVVGNLSSYSNVFYHSQNHPHINASDWFETFQTMLDDVRNHTDQIMCVQYGYDFDEGGTVDMAFVEDYPLYGSNILYTHHIYDGYGEFSSDYDALYIEYEYENLKYTQDTLDKAVHICEISPNSDLAGDALQTEYTWFRNSLHILNDWNVGYAVWWWWFAAGTAYELFDYTQGSSGPWIPQPVDYTGICTVEQTNANPKVWTCGNGTTDLHYYWNNVSVTENWVEANGTLQVSVSGPAVLRIWWEVWNSTSNSTLDVTDTLKVRFENGTTHNATQYYSASTKLMTFNVGAESLSISTFQNASETENVWQYTFNHLDLDSNVVDSEVTWQLYNSSLLLSYTKSSYTLLDGTYTLKTYYHDKLINTSSFSTATYGNTTVDVNLQMKSHQSKTGGYITSNLTLSTLTIHSQTSTNLTFTAENATSGSCLLIVDAPRNASSVKRNGVTQTGWTYQDGYIKIEAPQLSTWQFTFAESSGFYWPTGYSLTVTTISGPDLLSNVKVKVDGKWGYTSLDGSVHFNLQQSVYTVTATHNEKTRSQQVTLDRDMEITLDFSKPTFPPLTFWELPVFTSGTAAAIVMVASILLLLGWALKGGSNEYRR